MSKPSAAFHDFDAYERLVGEARTTIVTIDARGALFNDHSSQAQIARIVGQGPHGLPAQPGATRVARLMGISRRTNEQRNTGLI